MRIGCTTYSIRHALEAGELKFTDETWKALKGLGVEGVELKDFHMERFLDDYPDEACVGDLKERVEAHGLEVFCLSIATPFTTPNATMRALTSDMAVEVVEIAGALGIPFVRVDIGNLHLTWQLPYSRAGPKNLEWAVEGLRPVLARAREVGVQVGQENHGSFMADIVWLEKLVMHPDLEGLGVVLDIGNWPDDTRYEDIGRVIEKGWLKYFHAKTHVFDEDGYEAELDYPRVKAIADAHGWDGWWSVEWEGTGMTDLEGVEKTIGLLQKMGK
ncbi:MAG: sugar phosphate isomerase/epimerase family protein [Promethearchaeota archaeon]